MNDYVVHGTLYSYSRPYEGCGTAYHHIPRAAVSTHVKGLTPLSVVATTIALGIHVFFETREVSL